MNFKDLFVPRYLNSNPEVRINFVNKSEDTTLLKQMAEKDKDEAVRKAAEDRVKWLHSDDHRRAA